MISGTEKSKLAISRDAVILSDAEIAGRYLGIKKLPCKISSPFREDDDNPSFSLFEREGKVFWKDFGTGESGDVVSMMAKLWGVNYQEALLKLRLDSGQAIPSTSLMRKYKGKITLTHGSSIKVRIRNWKQWDIAFWKQFGISPGMCRFCNVHPISHAFFSRTEDGVERVVCVPMDKYAYAYFEWKDGVESIKLYQPYSDRMKWLSKHDKSVWDLWMQVFKWNEVHKSDSVIITSSRKDAMCLWETLKVPALSLQGEGYIPKANVMNQVFDTFENVYLWYDNDFKHTDGHNPGQEDAQKLLELFPRLKNICIPDSYKSKDPSDLYKNWGRAMVLEIWNTAKENS